MLGQRLDLLCLGEVVCKLLERRLGKLCLLPKVRGQVGVGPCNGSKCGLSWGRRER